MPLLQNDHLRLSITGNGELTELTCLATGTNHLAIAGLPLWRVILQDDESLVNLVLPEYQPVSAYKQGEMVVITVPCLTYHTHAGMRTVDVALRLEVSLQDDAAHWSVVIDNRDPHIRVMEVCAPMINGLRPPADWALYYPQDCGLRLLDPVANLGDRGQMFRFGVTNAYLREFYPGKASMQWMGLYGTGEGLYCCSQDMSLQTTCLNVERNFGETPAQDSLLLSFIKYPGLRAGVWRSAPLVVAPHVGDWHAGARRYRDWTRQWITPATPPEWVQRMPGLQDTILREQYGKVNYAYDDIPRLAAAAQEVGIDLVKLTGWHTGGHDNEYPDWQADVRLGGDEHFRAKLDEAHENGARMMLYLQPTQMSRNSRFYAEHGPQVSMRDPYGDELADTFTWPGASTYLPMSAQHQLVCACMSTPAWQRIVKDRVQYCLDFDVACVYLDRMAGYPGYLCFAEGHAHASPGTTFADRLQLGRECRDMVAAHNPEVALASEYINDAGLQPYDFTIPFGHGVHYGGRNFGELFRYTFPEYIITTQYLNGAEYDRLRFALVMGFRFFFAINWQHNAISETPVAFRNYVRSLIELLAAHADPFLLGHFVDTEGMRNDNPALFAKAYRSEHAFGIAVWNPSDEEQPLTIVHEHDAPLRWHSPDGVLTDTLPAHGVALAVC